MVELNEAELITLKSFSTTEIHLSDLLWNECVFWAVAVNSKSSKREGKQNQIKPYGCNHTSTSHSIFFKAQKKKLLQWTSQLRG